MITIEYAEILGWNHAIRGMRNPMNSWEKSDSIFAIAGDDEWHTIQGDLRPSPYICEDGMDIGPNDHDLMLHLAKNGPVHAKYRRMITVYMDVTAPLYWWKEFDTYKVGTVANSCSTMHKIHAKEFTLEDFSYDHLINYELYSRCEIHVPTLKSDPHTYYGGMRLLELTINVLNFYRQKFLETQDKLYWWQIIQLLPSSYHQTRTVMLNYEVLNNIYKNRKEHKLDEWREFCRWIERLPYSELITLNFQEEENHD